MSAPRLLFLCLGNICRSPLVEAVARQHCAQAGLEVAVASRGTGDWHVGKCADPRVERAAAAVGIDLSRHRARQLRRADGDDFDLILAMDEDNLAEARRIISPEARARVELFLPWAGVTAPREFPDPYYGSQQGFADSVTLAERAVAGMIRRLSEA